MRIFYAVERKYNEKSATQWKKEEIVETSKTEISYRGLPLLRLAQSLIIYFIFSESEKYKWNPPQNS